MSANRKPIRVFQVATGNVGSEMIKRIAPVESATATGTSFRKKPNVTSVQRSLTPEHATQVSCEACM